MKYNVNKIVIITIKFLIYKNTIKIKKIYQYNSQSIIIIIFLFKISNN